MATGTKPAAATRQLGNSAPASDEKAVAGGDALPAKKAKSKKQAKKPPKKGKGR